MENQAIEHSGIPGMHWYQRRFQYEDGSLTPAGKERYGKKGTSSSGSESSEKKLSRKEIRQVKMEAKKRTQEAKAEEKKKKEEALLEKKKKKQKDSITRQSISKKELGMMSDDELNDRINRLKKEKEYLELSGNVSSKSKKKVQTILGKAGEKAATDIATSVLTYAGKQVVKQFIDDNTYSEIFGGKKNKNKDKDD